MTHNDFLELDKRAQEIFRHVVESFIAEGAPVSSRSISRQVNLSPASIRNVMADLEYMGLLQAPHTSAGRLPTDMGLRYFVDGILEVGTLSSAERAAMEEECNNQSLSAEKVFERASSVLAGLSQCAGLVVIPTQASKPIRHIEFVSLAPQKAMTILVSEDGSVENRVIDLPPGITADMLRQAGAFLSEKLYGRTVDQMREMITREIQAREKEIGTLTKIVIETGLATQLSDGKLIVHGRSQLLNNAQALNNLETLKRLMEQLESQEIVSRLLSEAAEADGVKIYIGAENSIFEANGHALILSPYRSGTSNTIVGAIGVIGPKQLNYAKIIPSISYMAEMLGRRSHKLG